VSANPGRETVQQLLARHQARAAAPIAGIAASATVSAAADPLPSPTSSDPDVGDLAGGLPTQAQLDAIARGLSLTFATERCLRGWTLGAAELWHEPRDGTAYELVGIKVGIRRPRGGGTG